MVRIQGASRGAYQDMQLLMQRRKRAERQARMGIYVFPNPFGAWPTIALRMEGKMFRACLIISIFHLVFVFSGCSVLKYLDGSSTREIEIYRMSAEEMKSEIDRQDKIISEFENKNKYLRIQIEVMRQKTSEFENKNKYLGIQIEVMRQKTVEMAYEHEQERKSFKKEFGVVHELKAHISELELQMSEKEENINSLEERLVISRNREELRSINDYLFLQIKRDLQQRDRTIKKLEETIRELKEGSHDSVFIGSPRRSVVPEGRNNMPSNIPIPIKED